MSVDKETPLGTKAERDACTHDYKYRHDTDMERETYVCSKCGDFYRLYYEDMA